MFLKTLLIFAIVGLQQAIASPEAHAAASQAYAVLDGKGFISIMIGIYAKLAATGYIPFIKIDNTGVVNWQRRAVTTAQVLAPGLIILGLLMLVGN